MKISALSFPILIVIFLIAAVVIWVAGIRLSTSTDTIAEKFGLGGALGGLVLLSIVTNLPEIAIVISASLHNNFEMATGNLLGGIAVQTLVIVVLDVFGLGNKDTLTKRSTSLVLVLEATLVLVVLALVVIGHQMPASLVLYRVTPAGFLILISWLVGIKIISKTRKTLPEISEEKMDGENKDDNKKDDKKNKKNNTGKAILIFIICSIATLAAGVALEVTSNAIAKHIGMQGVIFGATILAAITSLPEISTGLEAVWLKDYEMAVSDILGGNAFLPVLFLLASICSPAGAGILPKAQKTDIYLAGLSMVLTAVYIAGLIIQPKKQYLRMGIDSIVILVVYILGIIGLVFVT